MRKTEVVESWVVYDTVLRGKGANSGGLHRVICAQDDWDAMDLEEQGNHTLVRSGITNEGEAEMLARGTSGDTLKSARLKKKL